MDGPSEPTTSPGTGYGTVLYDDVAHTLTVGLHLLRLGYRRRYRNDGISHSRADGGPVPSELPASPRRHPSFVGFPLGVYAGEFHSTLDLTHGVELERSLYHEQRRHSPATAEAAFASALCDRQSSYWNIHSKNIWWRRNSRLLAACSRTSKRRAHRPRTRRPRRHRTPPTLSATFPFTQSAWRPTAAPSALSH